MDRILGAIPNAAAADAAQQPVPLPVLREDLEIVRGAPLTNGAPAWVIFDPVNSRYFEVGREILDLLSIWRVGTVDKLIQRARDEFGRILSQGDIEEVIRFLMHNSLTRDLPGGDYKLFAARAEVGKKSWLSQAMHSYLFFRVPLVRPDRFLNKTWPLVAPLFTKTAAWIFALFGVLGLYFVSRQWEQFSGTFQYLLSFEGALIYFFSIVFVKSIHELGHAFMAKKYALQVPSIGIAFMVLFPVLYTDTSAAWRLQKRKQRLMIDGAGIFTELALASCATLLWAFLPDGGLRMAVFGVATTGWITSLLVNLNPLMRFDGYYILSDALGFQNMQQRGFDMARWRLREILFGLGDPAPEPLSVGMRRTVVIHAWATWIYRFFLFLGIALLVYSFFVKVVGIILFVIEILWFILLPVGREIGRWWSMRGSIFARPRTYLSLAVLGGLIALSLVPWSTSISAPSMLLPYQEARIHAAVPAEITKINVRSGDRVEKGAILFELRSEQLEAQLKQVDERAALLRERIERGGSDAADKASRLVLINELKSINEQKAGIRKLQSELVLRAPLSGVIADVDREAQIGLHVNSKTLLALVQGREREKVTGYVGEAALARFETGAQAVFLPEDPQVEKIPLKVVEVSYANAEALSSPYLAIRFGGSIATQEQDKDALRPKDAQFEIVLDPAGEIAGHGKAIRGITLIEGTPESFYVRVKRQVLKVLVREFGI